MVTIPFDKTPSWCIVALVSRIARHIQGFVARRGESDRKTVNDAIEAAEGSARCGRVDERATQLSDKARKVSEDAGKDGQPEASRAALCAAEAATAVCVVTDRQVLMQTAERALECVRGFCLPERDRVLQEEIEGLARLGHGLANHEPAPPEMLNFLYEQAVHEAGHAVAAYLLRIPLCGVRIIYNPETCPVWNPIHDPDDIPSEERSTYRLLYAAGAAAEALIFGKRKELWSTHDRKCYGKCGGTDFDEDASKVRRLSGFNCEALVLVASQLEKQHCLPGNAVEQILLAARCESDQAQRGRP